MKSLLYDLFTIHNVLYCPAKTLFVKTNLRTCLGSHKLS